LARRQTHPERYAESVRQDLHAAQRKGRSTVSHKISVIVSGSGWQKRSKQNLKQIASAFVQVVVFADTDIEDMRLGLDHRVTFSHTPFSKRNLGAEFSAEQHLKSFLAMHHRHTFSGLRGLEGLTLVGTEVRVEDADQERFIDVVFRESDGSLVAVELEKGDPQPDSMNQLRSYMRGLSSKGKPVRGILITGRPKAAQIEEDTIANLRGLGPKYPIEWYWYDASVALTRLL